MYFFYGSDNFVIKYGMLGIAFTITVYFIRPLIFGKKNEDGPEMWW